MARRIDFDAKHEAERLLEGPLQRTRWTVDTRDVLADALERIVTEAFRKEGLNVYNKGDD